MIFRKGTLKADSIVFEPKNELKKEDINLILIKDVLLNRIVKKGEIIEVNLDGQISNVSGSEFYMDIFELLEKTELPSLKLLVLNTSPRGLVQIKKETKLIIKSKESAESKKKITPKVSYNEVGGLKEELDKVRELAELPLTHPEYFERLGIDPPKGILFYGPPGTGKTLIAKALASETNSRFILINGPEIISKYYGSSEENLRKKFELAEKEAPAIIFIDEIDSIGPKRDKVSGDVERRVVAQLLACMDGFNERGKVVVIGATNSPDLLDSALRRPGRFDREIKIGIPSKAGRLEILKIHSKNMPLSKEVDLEKMANLTSNFVGADLAALTKEAAMIALRRFKYSLEEKHNNTPPKELLKNLVVKYEDFKKALKIVHPSVKKTNWKMNKS